MKFLATPLFRDALPFHCPSLPNVEVLEPPLTLVIHSFWRLGMERPAGSRHSSAAVTRAELDMGHSFVIQPDPTQGFPDPTRPGTCQWICDPTRPDPVVMAN